MCRPSDAGGGKSEQSWSGEGGCNKFLSRLQAGMNPFFIFAQRVIDDGGDETTAQPE